jgi:hypothetical protein
MNQPAPLQPDAHPHHGPHGHIPLDPGRVHVFDALELQYWCDEMGCNEAQLRAAVAAVGEHATRVREHLHG